MHVHHNTIRRWAYKQEYGQSNAIGMNPGSTGDVYSNWIEGLESRTSEEYFGIVYYGHGATNQLSRIYNNIILHTNTAFMFLNKEDTSRI